MPLQCAHFVAHLAHGSGVTLFHGEGQELTGILQTAAELVEHAHYFLQAGAFAPQLLCPFGIIPYPRGFQFLVDFLQTLALCRVVKDTP